MIRRWGVVASVVASIAACSGAADKGLFGDSSGDDGGTGGPGDGGKNGRNDGGKGGSSSGGSSSGDPPVVDSGNAYADANDLLGAACGTRAAAKRAPAYMYIVLDGSGSMAQANKWTAAVPALDALFDDLLAHPDPNLGVGLLVFSDERDTTQGNGPYPSSADVGIAFVDQAHHDALRARIDPSSPAQATPTLMVLQGAYKTIEAFVASPPLPPNGTKVVVFMTDGVPTDNSTTQTCTSTVAAETAKGITTFAVGIGPFPSTDTQNYDPVFMGNLAQAGGAAPAGCNPNETADATKLCHFQVTPGGKSAAQLEQDFLSAINTIRQRVVSCEIGIEGSVDPSKVNVVFKDGGGVEHVIPEGGANGWTFDNSPPTKVILHGTACATLKQDHQASVSFLLGCDTFKSQ